jgi:hypothetical protein
MGPSSPDSIRDLRASGFGHERPFAPPQEREPSLALIILFWLCLAFVVVKLYQNASKPELPMPPATSPVVAAPAPSRDAQAHASSVASPATRSAPTTSTVTRCVHNGSTTYSDRGCTGRSKVVEVNPNLNTADALPRNKADVSATHQPPLAAAPMIASANAPDPAVDQRTLCDKLEAEIQSIDSMARQPQSPQMQDLLAARRKAARDQQFRLHC